ncbi:hypothetical protein PR048_009425 [Dryococelus australis]|uniref:Uncharacterized protein n=1 Tax=Dryococelus australis TaxID=614101 RepID=A0ABQ9HZX1_9NEOP|nr:hypothetical protein PR048_009425 [Dryococelus australis]
MVSYSAYKSPASDKRNLKFQYGSLNRWKWLSYCKVEDGAFSKFCAIFSLRGGGVGYQPLGKLAKKKFKNCKDAIEEFNIHHKNCLLRQVNFKIAHVRDKTRLADTTLEALQTWDWMQLSSEDKAMMQKLQCAASSMEYRLTSSVFIP